MDNMVMNLPNIPARDGLGCAVDHLAINQQYIRPEFSLYRKNNNGNGLAQVETSASGRGALVGVCLQGGHRRQLFKGRSSSLHDFEPGSVYLRNFSDDYRADLTEPFDFLLLEMSSEYLQQLSLETGKPYNNEMVNLTGFKDPVLSHLLNALIPILAKPDESSALFVDEMVTAISSHILGSYGGAGLVTPGRVLGLAPWQEMRAKEFIRANLDKDISISDVAAACGLSRSYFIRAFRAVTGYTPHRWLLTQRIEQARHLVQTTTTPLAQIATLCGFADQSHLTRNFNQIVGISPGKLRRSVTLQT